MIKQSTLKFLRSLKSNNNREWFAENKSLYEEAKNDFDNFINQLIDEITKFDKSIQGLNAKECVFRIYRDIRFSKNKTPYKSNLGASIDPEGRKSGNAGYYIHIQPGNKSFIAGGSYIPDKDRLFKLRQHIISNGNELDKIIKAQTFKKLYGTLWENKLKTAPKGFPKEHKYSELLKYKSLIVWHYIDDKKLLSNGAEKYISEKAKVVYPLVNFINKAFKQ